MKKQKLTTDELNLVTGGTLYVESSTNGKKYKVTGFGTNTNTGQISLKYDNGREVGYVTTDLRKNSSLGAIIKKAVWDCADAKLFDHTITIDEDLI